MPQKKNRRVLLGAAFLMATSAVGPGFLTQTTVFTQSLGASFGFVILVSIMLDIGVQLNIWRVIAISKKRAQEIANLVVPGLGNFISVLIVLGGLAFNIGNIAGAGLGFNVLFGVSAEAGALMAAAMAIAIFLVKEAGQVLDRFAQIMGLLLLLLIVYVAIISQPPLAEAALKSVAPDTVDLMAIVTLVGGTVGGYIPFAGGHRLLDAGIKGKAALNQVTHSAIWGLTVASLIRIFLFLAVLGVITQGLIPDESNPPASVFQLAAGEIGYKLFGLVLLAAAITSVIGSAYTSISFVKTFGKEVAAHQNWLIIAFITLSTVVFITIGKPINLLILAGALNGLILPITLATMIVAAHRKKIVADYRHPRWLTLFGLLVVIIMAWLGGYTLIKQLPLLLFK